MNDVLRILVPTDGSDPAQRALRHVLAMAARGIPLEVHLLNVQPALHGVAVSLVPHSDLEGYHRDEGMKVLAESVGMVEGAGLTPHVHIGVGTPGDTVLAFADRLACDQIVMGTRGRGSMSALLLGSVARHVAAASPVPVTLLR